MVKQVLSDLPEPPLLHGLLAALVDMSPFVWGVARVSDGVLVYANPACRQDMLRYSGAEQPVGMTSQALGLVRSEAHRLDLVQRARQPGGHKQRYDFSGDKGAGAELVHSYLVEQDGAEYLVTTVVDISDVLATEQALAETTERLQKAQALARTGDYVSKLNSSEFNGSAEAMRILGLGDEAGVVTTTELFASFHPDDRSAVAAAMQAQIPSGGFEVEHRLLPDESGQVRWVFTRASVEQVDGGRFGLRGTVQDITERKHADEERQRLDEKVRQAQKLESLGVLAGGIAHDFNNLLASIMGNADFALLDAGLPAETRQRLSVIVTASQRAADLTRQLLAYSGKGRFVVEPVDLSVLVREMADLLAVTIDVDHRLEYDLANQLPAVHADGTQLRQVMMNLIINASEAIGAGGGRIGVSTRVQDCDATYLRAATLASDLEPGLHVVAEVSDTGVGMDSDTLRRLYDPFFTTKFTGRGLGMAAALGIVHGHKGAIRAQSEPGVGTLFSVFLPVSSEAARQVAVAPPHTRDWQGTDTVLIVDDDERVRSFAAGVLERFGYRALCAADGHAAVAQLQDAGVTPDVVLLDLTMPNMGGRETYRQLRARRPDLPIVLMSGYDEQDAMRQFDTGGLADFLAKPFLVDALMRSVRGALDADTASR